MATSREQRLTERLITGLKDLAEPERQPPKLSRSEVKGAIPAGRGYSESNYQPGTATSTGGIASPLTEGANGDPLTPDAAVLDRTYHAPSSVMSSDGILVWEITPVATIKFRDASGALAEFKLGNPYAQND